MLHATIKFKFNHTKIMFQLQDPETISVNRFGEISRQNI